MRKLILVAVILQLAIILTEQYKFGDIISFMRYCVNKKFTYKHFVVYVGGGPNVGQGQHNIFQRTSPVLRLCPPSLTGCVFDDLKKEETNTRNLEVKLDNYLDGISGFEVGTNEAMAARIEEMLKMCGPYSPTGNNCEHIATYVRYNQILSLQKDTFSSQFCLANKELCERIKEKEKEIQEGTEAEFECQDKEDKNKNSGS